jgi:uncharacterized protein
MVTADQIIAYVNQIAINFHPHRIVLFGSYAQGTPTPDSDVDLLISKKRWSASPLTVAGKIRIALGVPFAMDLIVRTEGQIEREMNAPDYFMQSIMQKGITLYAADDQRVGSKGGVRLRRRLRSTAIAQEVASR